MSVRELACRTGRHDRAVLQAVRDGRLPRADVPRIHGVCVQASAAEVGAWKAMSFATALAAARAADPSLPDTVVGWHSIHAVATALGVCYATANRRLAAANVPQLEWDAGTPFRTQRRVYAPQLGSTAYDGIDGPWTLATRRHAAADAQDRETPRPCTEVATRPAAGDGVSGTLGDSAP